MGRFNYDVVIDKIGTPAGYGNFKPNGVTVHHDAVSQPNSSSDLSLFKAYTKHHGSMPYHIVIPHGDHNYIYVTQYFTTWTVHNANYEGNRNCLAVMVMGYFTPPHNNHPTKMQLAKLEQVLNDLNSGWFEKNGWALPVISLYNVKSYSGVKVTGLHTHREIAQPGYPTSCPGNNLQPYVDEYRLKKGNVDWSNLIDDEEKMYKEKYEASQKEVSRLKTYGKELEKEVKELELLVSESKSELMKKGSPELQSKLDKARSELQKYHKLFLNFYYKE